MTDHSLGSIPSPDTRIPDASDALNRAAQMLDYLIDQRGYPGSGSDYHPGEGWIMGAIADGIAEALRLLNRAPPIDPETIEATAQKERVDRAVAESMTINTLKMAIAAHEARVGGGE